jgi:hypothetical protein
MCLRQLDSDIKFALQPASDYGCRGPDHADKVRASLPHFHNGIGVSGVLNRNSDQRNRLGGACFNSLLQGSY